jgi:DNA-directed RNA polymerase specialized sigma subunit
VALVEAMREFKPEIVFHLAAQALVRASYDNPADTIEVNAMGTLNAREKKILSLRFYAGKTQMEVAGEIGISQAQVSRLEKQAIGKIRGSVFPS